MNNGICQSNGVCRCDSRYTGSRCETLIGGCSLNYCQNGGTCSVNSNNTAVCTCRSGFYGSQCQTTNACQSGANNQSPCLNGATCIQQQFLPNGFFCICPSNYFGITCQVTDLNITCSTPDTNLLLCPLWSGTGFCNYRYTFDLIPVPVYCPFSCKSCNT